MDKVILRYMSLPTSVRGLTVQDEEGDYNIYVNARLAHEASKKTLQHELQHIESSDFGSILHIRDIESFARTANGK